MIHIKAIKRMFEACTVTTWDVSSPTDTYTLDEFKNAIKGQKVTGLVIVATLSEDLSSQTVAVVDTAVSDMVNQRNARFYDARLFVAEWLKRFVVLKSYFAYCQNPIKFSVLCEIVDLYDIRATVGKSPVKRATIIDTLKSYIKQCVR